jgi:tRNA(Ile)-lysidine synthase
MQLFEKFKHTLNTFGLSNSEKKILLAVSGGIDSVVMMHLFHRMKADCIVAHCNFQLRGNESDEDEAFVIEQTTKLNFQVHVTRFETEEYANENHLSIQMAARELRYNWFEKLAKVHQIDFIAVAHNRDDAMETFLINLGRGTGIGGLTGIRPISGNIIRPLLASSRQEIEEYAGASQIIFREDSSNASDKYLRNYIRHQLIPAFEEVFPHFRKSLSQNIEKLNDANLLYQHAVNQLLPDIFRHDNNLLHINIPKLLEAPAPKTLLFEILKQYSFSSATTDEVFQIIHSIPGKQFFSSTHKLVKDRTCFIVSKLENEAQNRFYIEEGIDTINHPILLNFKIVEITADFVIDKIAGTAMLDYDKLAFPLMLRKWHAGDYFMPLGMSGIKKISDFFVDIKLSRIEKENTWLLTSGDQILWIVGKRIDDRVKVTASTRKVLKVICP